MSNIQVSAWKISKKEVCSVAPQKDYYFVPFLKPSQQCFIHRTKKAFS